MRTNIIFISYCIYLSFSANKGAINFQTLMNGYSYSILLFLEPVIRYQPCTKKATRFD